MRKTKVNNLIAAIDIGSNYLRMTISEIDKIGDFVILEEVVKQTNIGKDSFSFGRVKVQTIHDVCNDLKGFTSLMKDYNVRVYEAVATSGIREADNKQYIIEQIRIRTGIKVRCLNEAEERFLLLKGMKKEFLKMDIDFSQNIMVLNITSGAVEASIYKNKVLQFTESMKLGSLRISEMLADFQNKTLEFPRLMEEYIESKIYLPKMNIRKIKVDYLVVVGGEFSTVTNILKKSINDKEIDLINRADFVKLYEEIKKMSGDQISFNYNVHKRKVYLFLSTILLTDSFLNLTEAKEIYSPEVTFRQGILKDIYDNLINENNEGFDKEDIISSVWNLGDKYKIDKKHARYVLGTALNIFDKTEKLHKLGRRERLYLEISSILHDVGTFVNYINHEVHSYEIIKNTSIIGLSDNELNIIANIIRYHEDENISLEKDPNYYVLSEKDRMTVSILAAILKLSEALDSSHLQKIEDLKISVTSDAIYFSLVAKEDILLEEWNFKNSAYFFEEVIGIKAII